MRPAQLSALALLALGLACGGPPIHERHERAFSYGNEVPEVFQDMDLPWYGGQIVQANPYTMTVSYVSDEATPEQLRTWWPEALEAEGWTIETPHLSGNGRLDAVVQTPAGRRGILTIRPEGTLWWVILSLDR